MRSHQQKLIQLITSETLNSEDLAIVFKCFGAKDLANIFVDATFLINAFQFIQEKYWLQKKDNDDEKEIIFGNFIKKFLKSELTPALFFHAVMMESSIQKMVLFKKNAETIQKSVLKHVKNLILPENKNFAIHAIKLMSDLYEFAYQLSMNKSSKGESLDYSLYRSFDVLDYFFNLKYEIEFTPQIDVSKERDFYGSGASVQSSYTTILLALRYLKIPTGSRFVDLGSGFGRVGLTLGLLRPDLQFRGYEIAQQRVDMAALASQSLGMSSHVKFFTEDLSAGNFLIPEAETYYLFDPFSEETYEHVLSQLRVIGSRMKINIITKGNAKQYFLNAKVKSPWSRPQEFEHGNFCLFRS